MTELGFSQCGFAKAEELTEDLEYFNNWLSQGFHAEKAYLERSPETRANPLKLMPEARSVISATLNYYTPQTLPESQFYKVSRYAYGKDYHKVLTAKLSLIKDFILENTSGKNCMFFVDSSPIFEKAWAKRAGLGWIGKNTLLLNQNTGSFHFIGTIITDIELEYDDVNPEHCGTCTKCIDACPTNALNPLEIDVRRCISNLTMDPRKDIPQEYKGKLENYIYGCDICQTVCPWNAKLEETKENDFMPSAELLEMTKEDWENITEEKFGKLFSDTAVLKIKHIILKRNIDFIRSKN